ncbi:formylglycine-generating enzyme family protein [Chitinophaga silvatica]|uniref:Formylglycine-generating enzyme family protein n=2 Tax=Chitinophaga silvatica TaxID=2282649 RepID=A0A3E1YE51_9BACT|nr:formylglycine-generating enzyme family protein [Chitinophaga silvatica]
MKYIFMVVLVTTALSISCSQSNSKKSLNATAFDIEPEMVTVQGGTFAMGGNEENNKPIHNVTLNSFKIAKYETTQAQWEKVMGKNPVSNPGCADCPVESVSWEMVQTYITKLNRLTGKHYRLPTEAEWEYAARGGRKSKNFEFAGSNDIKAVAWTSLDSGLNPHPVGQKKPNELGLYDMSGNVWEWCNDWYDENYYRKSPKNNPTGPATKPPDKKNDDGLIAPLRVVRGGNSGNGSAQSRVASRPNYRLGYHSIGFRLASSS